MGTSAFESWASKWNLAAYQSEPQLQQREGAPTVSTWAKLWHSIPCSTSGQSWISGDARELGMTWIINPWTGNTPWPVSRGLCSSGCVSRCSQSWGTKKPDFGEQVVKPEMFLAYSKKTPVRCHLPVTQSPASFLKGFTFPLETGDCISCICL